MRNGIWSRGARGLAFLMVLTSLSACSWGGGPTNGTQPGQKGGLLLAEVYPRGFADDSSDQFLRLYNSADQPLDLAGWSLSDGKVRATFPPGAQVGPRQSIYVARDAEGFRKVMGARPDFVWRGGNREVPALNGGAALLLGREAGQVILRTGDAREADTLVYGTAAAATGWKGAAVPAPITGEAIDRARDEAGWDDRQAGGYVADTDTAADWKQGKSWVDQRVYRPGQTWFGSPTYSADNVTLYASPDSSYRTVSDLLVRARKSIDITVYDFSLIPVAEQLAAAARRGVQVRLLIEAGSATRLYDGERYVAQVVAEAGGEVRWIVNDPSRGYRGRYVYNHAKYGVVDGRWSFVQSENLVRHGTPVDPTFGNRGWGVTVEHAALAAYLSRVFEADWTTMYGDVALYQPGTPFGPPGAGYAPETEVLKGSYPHPFPPMTLRGPVQITPVLAPEHTLLETRGIIGMMRSAKESLFIQQQYIHPYWGPNGTGPAATPDLYLEEAIKAARRGVRVRMLMSDSFIDPREPKDSSHTVNYVNEIARTEGLDMEARLIDSKLAALDKIHNKGVIVDERKVLVSSINWSYNSPANNRELGLILEHPDVGRYYADIFTYDWYDGTPADYPLVTEVNPAAGYVEVTHYGSKPVEAAGWKLATAARSWDLPAGLRFEPGRPVLLVGDAAAFKARYGNLPGVVELTGLALAAGRESIQLRSRSRLVDAMAWGEAEPGWKLALPAGAAVCRENPGKDTNTYLDWSTGAASPGMAGCGK